jgi:hypothetical protein
MSKETLQIIGFSFLSGAMIVAIFYIDSVVNSNLAV